MYEPFLTIAFAGWFNGLIKAISQVWQLVVPNDVTKGQCIALTSLVVTGIFIYRTALQGFLLWRLKNIEHKKKDLWIGVALFTTRFAQFFQIRPEVAYDDEENAYFCNQGLDLARTQVLGYISIDLLIDCYVTFRFMQVLTKANKTALLMAGWTITGIYRSNDQELALYINSTQILLLIGLSYAITIDAEIVRVIEGRRPSIGSKSFKNITRYSRNAYVPNKNIQSFLTSSNNSATIIESFDNTDDSEIISIEENQNPSEDQGIVNEGETKEPSVNITSNDPIIN
ncbi:6232_t:CDS:2 [Entrophospora sp. SA101]|nr:6232_t:CDS:2 [Entrophospora sp. SA101]CAJ0827659.1 13737_t:CDS:2 [Entrophospora sp. SA101]